MEQEYSPTTSTAATSSSDVEGGDYYVCSKAITTESQPRTQLQQHQKQYQEPHPYMSLYEPLLVATEAETSDVQDNSSKTQQRQPEETSSSSSLAVTEQSPSSQRPRIDDAIGVCRAKKRLKVNYSANAIAENSIESIVHKEDFRMNLNEQIDHIVKTFLDHDDDDDDYNDGRDIITGGRIDDNVDYGKLDKLGIVLDQYSKRWENMYTLLVQYKKREGHCNIPKSHEEDGRNLGEWMIAQRLGKKNGILHDVKGKKLEELGIVWDQFSRQWHTMYIHFLYSSYHQREGHCNAPYGFKEDGQNIGRWVDTQR